MRRVTIAAGTAKRTAMMAVRDPALLSWMNSSVSGGRAERSMAKGAGDGAGVGTGAGTRSGH